MTPVMSYPGHSSLSCPSDAASLYGHTFMDHHTYIELPITNPWVLTSSHRPYVYMRLLFGWALMQRGCIYCKHLCAESSPSTVSSRYQKAPNAYL